MKACVHCVLLFAAGAAIAGQSQSALQAQAKITEATARATALQSVVNGTVSSSELETEHGKLVWSFDIKRANSADITEVQIDARSGAMVSRRIETPADQAREKAADAKAAQRHRKS